MCSLKLGAKELPDALNDEALSFLALADLGALSQTAHASRHMVVEALAWMPELSLDGDVTCPRWRHGLALASAAATRLQRIRYSQPPPLCAPFRQALLQLVSQSCQTLQSLEHPEHAHDEKVLQALAQCPELRSVTVVAEETDDHERVTEMVGSIVAACGKIEMLSVFGPGDVVARMLRCRRPLEMLATSLYCGAPSAGELLEALPCAPTLCALALTVDGAPSFETSRQLWQAIGSLRLLEHLVLTWLPGNGEDVDLFGDRLVELAAIELPRLVSLKITHDGAVRNLPRIRAPRLRQLRTCFDDAREFLSCVLALGADESLTSIHNCNPANDERGLEAMPEGLEATPQGQELIRQLRGLSLRSLRAWNAEFVLSETLARWFSECCADMEHFVAVLAAGSSKALFSDLMRRWSLLEHLELFECERASEDDGAAASESRKRLVFVRCLQSAALLDVLAHPNLEMLVIESSVHPLRANDLAHLLRRAPALQGLLLAKLDMDAQCPEAPPCSPEAALSSPEAGQQPADFYVRLSHVGNVHRALPVLANHICRLSVTLASKEVGADKTFLSALASVPAPYLRSLQLEYRGAPRALDTSDHLILQRLLDERSYPALQHISLPGFSGPSISFGRTVRSAAFPRIAPGSGQDVAR